jgi:hypothetical protein
MCGNPNVTRRPRLRTMPYSQAGPAAAPTPAYSPNRSGGMALAVPGDVEPTFNATCPSTSGYTMPGGRRSTRTMTKTIDSTQHVKGLTSDFHDGSPVTSSPSVPR